MRVYTISNGDGKIRFVGICQVAPYIIKPMNDPRYIKWLSQQKKIVIDFIETVSTRREAFDRELYWIQRLRSEGHDLLNMDGVKKSHESPIGKAKPFNL